MCRPANVGFLRSGFAWRPSLQNPLVLPLLWRRLIQWAVGLGEKKKSVITFFKPGTQKLYIEL
jgi:hypothetical protein